MSQSQLFISERHGYDEEHYFSEESCLRTESDWNKWLRIAEAHRSGPKIVLLSATPMNTSETSVTELINMLSFGRNNQRPCPAKGPGD